MHFEVSFDLGEAATPRHAAQMLRMLAYDIASQRGPAQPIGGIVRDRDTGRGVGSWRLEHNVKERV